MKINIIMFSFLLNVYFIKAQDAIQYQVPPQTIYDLATAKPTPGISFDDKGTWMLQLERSDMPTIEDLAQPELRIAGLRMNPNNYSPSRSTYNTSMSLTNVATKANFKIAGLPANAKIANVKWSPDNKKIAFTNTTSTQIDLYIIEVATKIAKKINKHPVNAVLGSMYEWYDNTTIFYLASMQPASMAPKKPLAPNGPVVQQNLGKTAASVTYQDLIRSPYDEKLFEFYSTTQLIKNTNGAESKINTPMIYESFDFSPDGKFILVSKIKKPFSYLVPASGFNATIFVMDIAGKNLQEIANIPSRELAPTGYDNVLNAQRGHNWVNTLPSTIMYISPLDSGFIKKNTPFHDALFFQDIGAKGAPKEIVKTKLRMGAVQPISETIFLISENSRVKQTSKTSKLDIVSNELSILFERSTNDAYNDPGNFVTAKNKFGKYVIFVKNNLGYVRGLGASAKGDLPFLRSIDLTTKETKEIWRCEEPYFESVTNIVDFEKMRFITSKQSQTEPANYYLYENGVSKKLTDFADPQPAMRGITKEKINYKRSDGVDLTADLYLPKGYNKDKDGRLPVIMWAYPREFKSSSDAAQVRGSKYTFVRVGWGSPVFWATQGYAVMDNAEFPIVGEGDQAPNDSFVEQLIDNAKAGLQKIHDMGVGDTSRAAVGGHSYGAFMTSNLLAHTNLFKAGISRSGAYNRTLTPFGFQNEERTYWQAPELYFRMSPFSYAHKIKTPILLIHGEADNNPGTFPIQSERLYNAIKGHGGIARYVQLPFESHGYAAKESILHMLWEQHQWLEKYVKNKK